MPIYDVTISRTEHITLRLQAISAEDAEERCLRDGDEMASETIDQGITLAVTEVSA